MSDTHFHKAADGIYCIDTLYTAPQIACCYLLLSGGEGAIIETGTARSVPIVLDTLAALDVRPEQIRYVIPTHVHLDHAGGSGPLMQHFEHAELLIHPRGARHLADPSRLIESSEHVYGKALFEQLYGTIIPVEKSRLRILEDGDTVQVGNRVLEVLHTRGHAEHHLCLFDRHTRGWFSGDMYGISYPRLRFPGGAFLMPATTPTQFDPALYAASVNALAAREPESIYLTHFGALPFAAGQAEILGRQLERYAEAGLRHPGDSEALQSEVRAITKDELRQFASGDAALQADTLQMDVRLNAQGIAWWSAQRAD